ncbi:MAG TPA: VOC family protein [Thermoplasmata archaeon]|nr:VOC family protein [Thermoplasmata archaeon]
MTIVVKDQDKALDFYTEKMGFEKKADYIQPGHPRYLTVSPKGQDIEMVLWPAGAEADRMPVSHTQPGIGTRTVLQVEDCGKTFDQLKKRGVRFKSPEPMEEAWGYAADLTDPDGNPFTIFQPRAPPTGPQDWDRKA